MSVPETTFGNESLLFNYIKIEEQDSNNDTTNHFSYFTENNIKEEYFNNTDKTNSDYDFYFSILDERNSANLLKNLFNFNNSDESTFETEERLVKSYETIPENIINNSGGNENNENIINIVQIRDSEIINNNNIDNNANNDSINNLNIDNPCSFQLLKKKKKRQENKKKESKNKEIKKETENKTNSITSSKRSNICQCWTCGVSHENLMVNEQRFWYDTQKRKSPRYIYTKIYNGNKSRAYFVLEKCFVKFSKNVQEKIILDIKNQVNELPDIFSCKSFYIDQEGNMFAKRL
jgi:hypothetical protein